MPDVKNSSAISEASSTSPPGLLRMSSRTPRERSGRFCAQPRDGLHELLVRAFLKLLQPEVENVRAEPLADHAGDLDLLADEVERERRVGAGSAHADLHLGPRGAAQLADELVERLAARGLAVDGDDAIARTNSGALGGRSLDGRDDGDGVVAQIDLDAHSAEFSLGVALEKTKILRRHVRRVRVELVHHSLDGALDHFLVIDRLDVLVLDQDQHATELSEVAVGAFVAAGGVGETSRQRAPAERGEGERGEGSQRRSSSRPTRLRRDRPGPGAWWCSWPQPSAS